MKWLLNILLLVAALQAGAQDVAGLYKTRHFTPSSIDLKPNGEYVYSAGDYHDFGSWTMLHDTVLTSTASGSIKRRLLFVDSTYEKYQASHIYFMQQRELDTTKSDVTNVAEYYFYEYYPVRKYFANGSTKSIISGSDGVITKITYYQGGALKEFSTLDDTYSTIYTYDVNGVLQNVVKEKRQRPKRK